VLTVLNVLKLSAFVMWSFLFLSVLLRPAQARVAALESNILQKVAPASIVRLPTLPIHGMGSLKEAIGLTKQRVAKNPLFAPTLSTSALSAPATRIAEQHSAFASVGSLHQPDSTNGDRTVAQVGFSPRHAPSPDDSTLPSASVTVAVADVESPAKTPLSLAQAQAQARRMMLLAKAAGPTQTAPVPAHNQ
jgi:hypothetical protein